MHNLKKDLQTVTPEGDRVEPLIEGVKVRRLRSIEDRRGDITEMYDPAWGIHPGAMVFAYQVSIHPGAVRGWEMHKIQDDRIFISRGFMRWVLFDMRPESPTYRRLNTVVASHLNRMLMIVPTGVVHAVQNIGQEEAVFINFPTVPYNHKDPDKYRLPLKNDVIPFDFGDGPGW